MAKSRYVIFRRLITDNPERQDEENMEIIGEVYKSKKAVSKAIKKKTEHDFDIVKKDKGDPSAYANYTKNGGLTSSVIGFVGEDGFHYDIAYNADAFKYFSK